MKLMKYTIILLVSTAFLKAGAIQIRDCGQGTWGVEVEEDSGNDSIICEEFGSDDTLEWLINTESGYRSLGACTPDGDCPIANPTITMTRASKATTSSFTIKSATRQLYKGYGVQCTASNQGVVSGPASCTVNIIYGARESATSCSNLTVHANRTLSGTCNIAKVYSSAGYYSCRLTYEILSSSALTTATYAPQSIDNSYNSGSCSFSAALPSFSGTTAVFYIIVYPGALLIQRNVSLNPPVKPTISCLPSLWVPDGSTVNCTCTTTSLGWPSGTLQGFRGSSNVIGESIDALTFTFVQILTKSDQGPLKCVVDWLLQDETSDVHIMNVSWGPNAVRIPENKVFATDVLGTRNLTLTCEASDVNPINNLTYSWTGRCQSFTGRTCTFKPRPGLDDNVSVGCTVTNTYNNNKAVQSDPYLLNLQYPPSTAPLITSSSTVLYAGDLFTLNCTVTGGKPLVTSVNFTCGSRQPDNATDVKGLHNVSTSLQMNLTSTDNGLLCICTAIWTVKSDYTQQNSTMLNVLYPPSTPVINRNDSLQYPYIAGDTVRLSCAVRSPGNPNATLTWVDNSQELKSSETPAILVLPSINKTYNLRIVSCSADNTFTQVKGRVLQDSLTLQVYYNPEVFIEPVSDRDPNNCSFTNDRSTCTVEEGQRIHLQCKADSNPLPANITFEPSWGAGSELLVGNANHTLHTGNYTCNVTTGRGNQSNDTRLPRMGFASVTVFVTYAAEIRTFSLNLQHEDLTVNETDNVAMTCLAVGRPSPAISIATNTVRLITMARSPVSFEDEAKRDYVIHNASCQDAGHYSCEVDNGKTPVTWKRLVKVNCKPQTAPSFATQELTVNYKDSPVNLTLELLAYPKIVQHTFVYLGSNKTLSVPAYSDKLNLLCADGTLLYNAITCNITVNNLDADSAGFYTLSIYNDFGSMDVQFEVTYSGLIKMKPVDPSDDGTAAVIGGVIGAVIVVVLVVILVVILFRRRNAGPDKQHERIIPGQNNTSKNDLETDVMIVNSAYSSSDDLGINTKNTDSQLTSAYEIVDFTGGNPAVPAKPEINPNASPKHRMDEYPVNCKKGTARGDPDPSWDVYASAVKTTGSKSTTQSGKPIKPQKEKGEKKGNKDDTKGSDPGDPKVYENLGFQSGKADNFNKQSEGMINNTNGSHQAKVSLTRMTWKLML